MTLAEESDKPPVENVGKMLGGHNCLFCSKEVIYPGHTAAERAAALDHMMGRCKR